MRCGRSITAYVEEIPIHGQVQSRVVARIRRCLVIEIMAAIARSLCWLRKWICIAACKPLEFFVYMLDDLYHRISDSVH